MISAHPEEVPPEQARSAVSKGFGTVSKGVVPVYRHPLEGGDGRRATGVEVEAVSAQVNLGYRRNAADRAVKAACAAGAADLESVIRSALKRVGA